MMKRIQPRALGERVCGWMKPLVGYTRVSIKLGVLKAHKVDVD